MTVTVAELPEDATVVTLVGCEGSTVNYNGNPLLPGTTTDFLFNNFNGCDSTVTVTVLSINGDTTAVALQICPNESINYLGQVLEAGDEVEILLTNWQGCDSLLQVSVTGYPETVWDVASTASCSNNGTGAVVLNIQQGDGPFVFSLNGGAGQAEPLFEGLPSGNYLYEITDAYDCSYEGDISVNAIPPIEAQIEVGDLGLQVIAPRCSLLCYPGKGI